MQLVFRVEASELGALGPAKNWIALAILGVVLVAIASEKIHRCGFLFLLFFFSYHFFTFPLALALPGLPFLTAI